MESLEDLISQTYFSNSIWQYLLFFGCILAGIIFGKVFYFICQHKLRKLADKSTTRFDNYLLDIIEEPLSLLIVTAGVWIGTFFLSLNEAAEKFFDNIILVMLAMTVTWFVMRLIDMLIRMYAEPLVSQSESKLDDAILPILRKVCQDHHSYFGSHHRSLESGI